MEEVKNQVLRHEIGGVFGNPGTSAAIFTRGKKGMT